MTELNNNGNKRGMSPNSRKNLELGHKPNIRTAKDFSITRIIKDMLDEKADFLGANGKTWRQAIAYKILDEARKGNSTLIKELLDRLEGKVALPLADADGESSLFGSLFKLVYPEGTVIKPGRMDGNGHTEVKAGGNGHKGN